MISTGFDLQSVHDMSEKRSLPDSLAVFTTDELAHCAGRAQPVESLTGLFSAKEAFYKAVGALPDVPVYGYPDVEIRHRRSGRPELLLHRSIAEYFSRTGLQAEVSISHSTGMAGAVVVIWQSGAAGQSAGDALG